MGKLFDCCSGVRHTILAQRGVSESVAFHGVYQSDIIALDALFTERSLFPAFDSDLISLI
jgi:hypothetical protein